MTESFAAGTLDRWGLSYDVMREIKPDVIYVSMCGFGHEGPDTSHVTMGPTAQALTGLTFMVGLPDRPPAGWSFSYLDHVGGYLGAIAILAGVIHRGRTGEGQHIDVSQLEPATALVRGAAPRRHAQRPAQPPAGLPDRQPPRPSPQRPRRARTGPRATTSGWWCRAAPRSTGTRWSRPWAARRGPTSPRFATLAGRVEHADDLDAHVEAWTSEHDRYEVMDLLQRAGVPAGAVQDAADRLERDPQLAARGHYTMLGNAEVDAPAARGRPLPHVGDAAAHRGGAAPGTALPRRGQRGRAGRAARDERRRRGRPGRRRGPVVTRAALEGVRVLELTDESAEYCGRLLAGLGADVVKVEPPEGAPSRAIGPFLDDEPGPDRSLAFWADNVGKRSVVVDDDAERARRCATRADVLVHTLRPAAGRGPGPRLRLPARRARRAWWCAPSPRSDRTGRGPTTSPTTSCSWRWAGRWRRAGTGPGADGDLRHSPPGVPRRPGLAHGVDLRGHRRAGRIGVARRSPASGQLIDVSAHECSAQHDRVAPHDVPVLGGRPPPRARTPPSPPPTAGRWPRSTPTSSAPMSSPACSRCSRTKGVAGPLSDPAFADPVHRAANYREVWRALKRLAEKNDGETLYQLGQGAGLPWGVIRSPDEVLDDRHLRARGHFVELDHPELGRSVTYSGAPFLAHGSPWVMRPPPPAAR